MAEIDYGIMGQINPYSAYAKANQQANLANELAILEAQQKAQQLAQSGQQNTPAALQLANEYQAAMQSGDTARANQIAAFAKVYDKGVSVGEDGFGVAGGYADALGELNKQRAAGTAQGGFQTQAQVDLPTATATAYNTKRTISQLLNSPGLPSIFGIPGQFPNIPASEAANAKALYDQLVGQSFLQGFQMLKGGGTVTEIEGRKAEAAYLRAANAQTVEQFTQATREFETIVDSGVKKLQAQASGEIFKPSYTQGIADQYNSGYIPDDAEMVLTPAFGDGNGNAPTFKGAPVPAPNASKKLVYNPTTGEFQ